MDFQLRLGQYHRHPPAPHLRLKFTRQLRYSRSPTLRGAPWTPRCQARFPSASPAPGIRRSPSPRQARRLQRRRERGRGGAPRGGGPETLACRRAFPVAPAPQFCRGRLGLAQRGPRREGADFPEPAGPRPGAPNMSKPIPGKLPGVPSQGGGGEERLQKLSHMPFHSPHLPLLLRGTLSSPQHRCSWRCPGRREAGGGARAAGVTCRESFQLLGAVPYPRDGPRGAASSAVHGCLSSGSRRGHCAHSCHSEGCVPARPPRPASLGPHPGLIGSANPRPCACSRRHLPLARPPGPRLPRPSPPGAAAAPRTR